MSSRSIPPFELAVLGLLWQQPRSGYDLLKVFSETAMGGFSSSPGAIYPALKRLERAGTVKGRVENRNSLRPRQVFALSAAGQKALERDLRKPVTRDDVVRRVDGIMLRFVFAGQVLGRDEAVRILLAFATEIEAYLPELVAQLADQPPEAGPYGKCALQYGIDSYRANARWARKAAGQLQRGALARTTTASRPRKPKRRGGHKS